jgi:hypothetical protein
MRMSHRQFGKLRLMRALEIVMPFDAFVFFPDITESDWSPHRH